MPLSVSLPRIFSKAFGTIRHVTLMKKMAQLKLTDKIFNSIKDVFDNRSHCTKYLVAASIHAIIQACVIQGSGLGPAIYLVTLSDLRPVHSGNRIVKFADIAHLIVGLPARNSESRVAELAQIQAMGGE